MPAQQSPDELEVVPGFGHEKLQGWVPELASENEVREALEKAFDYRGDITITRKDGTQVEGYLFDRRQGKTLGGIAGADFAGEWAAGEYSVCGCGGAAI